ncbi:hypothetical protein TYRP_020134, partial [Tyrophagus putrescentiae]
MASFKASTFHRRWIDFSRRLFSKSLLSQNGSIKLLTQRRADATDHKGHRQRLDPILGRDGQPSGVVHQLFALHKGRHEERRNDAANAVHELQKLEHARIADGKDFNHPNFAGFKGKKWLKSRVPGTGANAVQHKAAHQHPEGSVVGHQRRADAHHQDKEGHHQLPIQPTVHPKAERSAQIANIHCHSKVGTLVEAHIVDEPQVDQYRPEDVDDDALGE